MIDDLTPPHWGAEPITTAPERIWLQDNGDFDAASEVTWCQHRIDDNDTEYVRADLAAVTAERDRMREALKQIETLWYNDDSGAQNAVEAFAIARAAIEGVTENKS